MTHSFLAAGSHRWKYKFLCNYIFGLLHRTTLYLTLYHRFIYQLPIWFPVLCALITENKINMFRFLSWTFKTLSPEGISKSVEPKQEDIVKVILLQCLFISSFFHKKILAGQKKMIVLSSRTPAPGLNLNLRWKLQIQTRLQLIGKKYCFSLGNTRNSVSQSHTDISSHKQTFVSQFV